MLLKMHPVQNGFEELFNVINIISIMIGFQNYKMIKLINTHKEIKNFKKENSVVIVSKH